MGTKKAALAALLGICLTQSAEAQTRSSRSSPTYGFAYGEFSHFDGEGLRADGGGGGLGWHFTRYLGIQGGGSVSTGLCTLLISHSRVVQLQKIRAYAAIPGGYRHGRRGNVHSCG